MKRRRGFEVRHLVVVVQFHGIESMQFNLLAATFECVSPVSVALNFILLPQSC